MADDGGDWFGAGNAENDAPPQISLITSSMKKKKTKEEAPKAEAAPPPEPEPQPEEAPFDDDYIDPDKLLLFKHWIRPKFLQYRYLYDYRRNYYDDVIDFLDKRQHGLLRDIPRPQTWAERALRTYNSKITKKNYVKNASEDTKLCTKIRLSGAFQSYHTREYFNRRYSSIM